MPKSKTIETALSLVSDASKVLSLTINGKNITPGEHVPKANAQSAPELTLTGPVANTTSYLVINVDLDAPFQSWPILGPILHWIQTDLKPTDGTGKLTWPSDTAPIANYIGPGPPPGAAPHRYVFILYEQPAEFDATKWVPAGGKKEMGMRPRMRYDLDGFVKEAKLGAIVAVNYFNSN